MSRASGKRSKIRGASGSAPQPALSQIRDSAQTLLDEGKAEEAFELFLSALGSVLEKNRDLELLVAKMQRERVGKRSERIDPAQLSLLLEQLCAQPTPEPVNPEAETESDAKLDCEIEQNERAKGKKKSRRKRRRCLEIEGAEKHVHHHEVPEEEQICSECGEAKDKIGEDISRVVEYVPGHFVEHEHHQDKYACGKCKQGVSTAPGPVKVLDRSPAGASLLAHVVVSKFVDHSPLHRLHRIYGRYGAEIPVSTMSDWMAGVADLAEPLVEALAQRVLGAFVVRTDATGLKVLDPSSPENIERGTMWCYVGDDRDVVFRYTPTGEGSSGPWEFLARREGYIQADASNVFDRLFNGQVASAIELGCMCHARRGLFELKDTDCRVAYPLLLIRRLYRIEHLGDVKELSPEERTALRQERSVPTLEKLKRWLVATQASEPPSSNLAKATAYFLNHWEALCRFTEDGRLDLDNNLCESQLRDIALGRKNFLFAGSHEAAKRAAVLYSLMRTCAQHVVPPQQYLTDVLRKLAEGWPQTRIEELLPDRWKASRDQSPGR